MKHAREDYQTIQEGCSPRIIPDDEPVFLLRAKDKTAAEVVRYWVTLQSENPNADPEIMRLADQQANKMDEWPEKQWADLPIKAKP